MSVVRRVLAPTFLAVFVVAGLPSAGAQTGEVVSVIGSADGLEVVLEVQEIPVPAQETVAFGPEPSVTLPPEGGEVSDEILNVDIDEGPVALSVSQVAVSAEGEIGPDGFVTAETVVNELFLGVAPVNAADAGAQQLLTILDAEAISATCEADLDGVSASTTLLAVSLLGEELEESPEPNTSFEIDAGGLGTANLVLNAQEVLPDGSIRVVPLSVSIATEVFNANLVVGPAVCGVVESVEPDDVVPAPEDLRPAAERAEPLRAAPRFTG